jgi:hypothetical protein
VPWPANALSSFESLHPLANFGDVADNLVARDSGEHVSHVPFCHHGVRMTDTAGKDLDQNLTCAGVF